MLTYAKICYFDLFFIIVKFRHFLQNHQINALYILHVGKHTKGAGKDIFHQHLSKEGKINESKAQWTAAMRSQILIFLTAHKTTICSSILISQLLCKYSLTGVLSNTSKSTKNFFRSKIMFARP